jgi:hypothetical protein
VSVSRRKLLLSSLGASQLYLLSKYNLLGRRAHAGAPVDRPTKLLTIMIPGGIHHEFVWSPFYDSSIARWIPPAENMPGIFYDATMVENLDRSGNADADAPIRRLRSHVTWSWEEPSDRTMGEPNNKGYVWAAPEHALYESTAIIHGIDQGTAAHQSGQIASMCGIAGGNFALPAIPAMIANHMLASFPDRPVPNLSIGGAVAAPAVTLPSSVNPANIATVGDLEYALSDRRPNWSGLRARTDAPRTSFDGTPGLETAPLTVIDAAGLRAVRALRGRSSEGTDTVLEQLHDTYAGVSRTIARDIVDIVEGTPGVEHLPAHMPWTPTNSRFGWQLGYADFFATDGLWGSQFDLALRMLKSDLATSVSLSLVATINFDSHYSNPYPSHANHLRGAMETVGRLLAEMKLTPSASRADRSLLDETLVYITSDFGRTFPVGGGSDHNPMHSAVLVNGLIQGNRMIGGYRDEPLGIPVAMHEEAGERSMRAPNARDVAATIYACFGMEPGVDFFIPGGYGVVEGISGTSV